ncbi:MAG TPA: prepilin peptidase [Sulfurospirillum arcachonense]|nr:prepilin peptidase [Sulfurospirillum arcachonense]
MITSTLAIVIFYGFIGLAVGSFLNVVIIRVPKGESISLPASHCVTCKHPLKWYHNIPIFSWVFLGGKCAYCKEKISIQYPIIEALTTFIFISTAYQTSFVAETLILSTLFTMLLALSVIDFKYKAVPDCISIPALFVALFVDDFLISLNDALLLAGGFALLRIFVSWIIKKEAMGEADIIIAGIIGATVGVELGLAAIYISALIALPVFMIVKKKGYELPFIPFLALGLYITWVFSPQVTTVLRMIYG